MSLEQAKELAEKIKTDLRSAIRQHQQANHHSRFNEADLSLALYAKNSRANSLGDWCSMNEMNTFIDYLSERQKIIDQSGPLLNQARETQNKLSSEAERLQKQCDEYEQEIENYKQQAEETQKEMTNGSVNIERLQRQSEEQQAQVEKQDLERAELERKEKQSSMDVQQKIQELAQLENQIEQDRKEKQDEQDKELDMYKKVILKPTEFYDIVLRYYAFSDIMDPEKGWQLYFSERLVDRSQDFSHGDQCPSFDGVPVAVVGDFNRGKTWLLSKITKEELPCGDVVTTPGICAKAVQVEATRFIILDTAGLNSPVYSVQQQGLKEKKAEEGLLRDMSFRMCSTYLFVVNAITAKEQLEIFQLSRDLYQDKKKMDKSGLVMVVHNLRHVDNEKKLQLHLDKLRSIYNATPPEGYSECQEQGMGRFGRIGSTVKFRLPINNSSRTLQGVIEAMDETCVVVHLLEPLPMNHGIGKTMGYDDHESWKAEGPDLVYVGREHWEKEAEVEVLRKDDEEHNLVKELTFEVVLETGETNSKGHPIFQKQQGIYFHGNQSPDGPHTQFFEMQMHFILGKQGTPGGRMNAATIQWIRDKIKHAQGQGESMNFIEELQEAFDAVLPRYFSCGGPEKYRPEIQIQPPTRRDAPRKVFAQSKEVSTETKDAAPSPRRAASDRNLMDDSVVANKDACEQSQPPKLELRVFELGTFTQIKSLNTTIPYGIFRGTKPRPFVSPEDLKPPLETWTIVFEVPGLTEEQVHLKIEPNSDQRGSTSKLVFIAKKPKPEDLKIFVEQGYGTLIFEDEPAPIEIPITFQINPACLSQKIEIKKGVLRFVIEEADLIIKKEEEFPGDAALQRLSLGELLDLADAHNIDVPDDCDAKENVLAFIREARLATCDGH